MVFFNYFSALTRRHIGAARTRDTSPAAISNWASYASRPLAGPVSTVSKDQAQLFRSIMEASEPDLVPTTTIDTQGNIRLDICLECHMNMGGVKGTETVN